MLRLGSTKAETRQCASCLILAGCLPGLVVFLLEFYSFYCLDLKMPLLDQRTSHAPSFYQKISTSHPAQSQKILQITQKFQICKPVLSVCVSHVCSGSQWEAVRVRVNQSESTLLTVPPGSRGVATPCNESFN